MGVARARDGLVSWLELKITHMNATSRVDGREMVLSLVGAMQNATEVDIKMGPPPKDSTAMVLDPIEVAKSQGALVSTLNEVVGHMNATSKVSATTLVRDLIDSMADYTGVSSVDVVLVPGMPPGSTALPVLMLDKLPIASPALADGPGMAPFVFAYVLGVLSAAVAAGALAYARQRAQEDRSRRIPLAVRIGAYQTYSEAQRQSRDALLSRR